MNRIETTHKYYNSAPHASLHAQRRLRQRGLHESDLDRLQRYGETFDDGYLMSNRTIDRHITQLKSEIQHLERLKGVVLIEQDDTVVTVYRSSRSRQRRILSGQFRRDRKHRGGTHQ